MKPNCYNCHYRKPIPGDAHSRCAHPDINSDLLSDLLSIFNIECSAVANPGAEHKLGIVANMVGVNKGWFDWPHNFDPVWLVECDGYEPIEIPWWEDSGQ